ncbi:MAG TPA: hypothetical protein IAC04_04780 [Candidatus Coprenecus stercoravium]|uniref:NfeD-like C-terminal domain-containing protein n=1 Tax=Candidatus Coprenecus stercoravium TaxID=2840735 RepID=A0A9D2GQG6_9BACT|nr:hypothetical protein [Candidatus Coprenecus stercoravium]
MAIIIALTILGIVMVLAEIFIFPGVFVAGIFGLFSMAAACWFAFDIYGATAGYITIAANLVLATACIIVMFRTGTWGKLSLHTRIDSHAGETPEERGLKVGSIGTSITRLNPMGRVLFLEGALECIARDGFIDYGKDVVVVLIEDNKIYVTQKQQNNNNTHSI